MDPANDPPTDTKGQAALRGACRVQPRVGGLPPTLTHALSAVRNPHTPQPPHTRQREAEPVMGLRPFQATARCIRTPVRLSHVGCHKGSVPTVLGRSGLCIDERRFVMLYAAIDIHKHAFQAAAQHRLEVAAAE